MQVCVFVIPCGHSFALNFAMQLSAMFRLAENERYNAQEVGYSQLFKLIKTPVKKTLMSPSQACVKLTKT